MHTTNEKISTWPKEARNQVKCDPRCDRNVGRKSAENGNQQKRVSGENSQKQIFYGYGCRITGGILRQLIDEYRSQLADEIEQKKQTEAKIVQIESRIQEFNSLLNELEANKET